MIYIFYLLSSIEQHAVWITFILVSHWEAFCSVDVHTHNTWNCTKHPQFQFNQVSNVANMIQYEWFLAKINESHVAQVPANLLDLTVTKTDIQYIQETTCYYQISREKFETEPGFEPQTSGSLAWHSTNWATLVQLPAHAQTLLLKHRCHLQGLMVWDTICHLLTISELTFTFLTWIWYVLWHLFQKGSFAYELAVEPG